jgi:vancomycin permeability regulator SanA
MIQLSETTATAATRKGRASAPRRGRWRAVRTLYGLILVVIMLAPAAVAWVRVSAGGHLYNVADAPAADVVMVLGAQLAPDGSGPMPLLASRLRVGAELVKTGKAGYLLLSGDGNGRSGNETAAMRRYLTEELGVDGTRVILDPYGLDTYDSCARAKRFFGVTRLLVVTSDFHLARAVTLCRGLGLDADGVSSSCPDCTLKTRLWNPFRETFACWKAVVDLVSGREPAVLSPA